MTVASIKALLQSNTPITADVATKLLEAAKDGLGIDADEKAFLQNIISSNTFVSDDVKAAFSTAFEAALPKPKVFIQESRPSWTTTYFPMSDSGGKKIGNPESNLWAKDGAADMFDKVLKARGLPTGARDFELQPAVNWLVGKPSGGYMPDYSVSEANAELTTGIDFDGDGKLTAGVKRNIIDVDGLIVREGTSRNTSTDQSTSVGWWGHCDEVGAAGIMFREPVKAVELNGAKFSPTMVKGLLSMISQSQGGSTEYVGTRNNERFDQVTLANGTTVLGRIDVDFKFGANTRFSGDNATFSPQSLPDTFKITLTDGTVKTLSKNEVRSVVRELQREVPSMFHTKMIEWLKEGRPAVMDKDDGEHLWNYNWHKLKDDLYENGLKPDWADGCDLTNGYAGPVQPGDEVTYVDRAVTLGGGGGEENYQYWVAKRNGQIVNSGWAQGSTTPDFLWRPTREPNFTGSNPRNPFIKPEIVKEIYLASLSDDDRAAEKRRLGVP